MLTVCESTAFTICKQLFSPSSRASGSAPPAAPPRPVLSLHLLPHISSLLGEGPFRSLIGE